METGLIKVVTHIQVLPFVSLRNRSDSNSKILAAFVLLVLLIAVQLAVVAYSLWVRMSDAISPWQIFQVLTMLMQSVTCIC